MQKFSVAFLIIFFDIKHLSEKKLQKLALPYMFIDSDQKILMISFQLSGRHKEEL